MPTDDLLRRVSGQNYTALDDVGGLTTETDPHRIDDRVILIKNGVGIRECSIGDLLGTGWGFYSDSTYTSGAPLAVNNARVQLTCDGLGGTTEKGYLPTGVSDFWSSNKLTPENVGDGYDLRISFQGSAAANNAEMNIELDIGSDPFGASSIVVSANTFFAKASGSNYFMTWPIPIFSLATFIANGGAIALDTSVSGDNFSIWDIRVYVARTHAAL